MSVTLMQNCVAMRLVYFVWVERLRFENVVEFYAEVEK